MELDSWVPGAPCQRSRRVTAAVARSDAIREEEAALEVFALFAVQVDARVRLSMENIKIEASRQLRVPFLELGVSRLSTTTFLIKFDNQLQRNAVRGKTLRIGQTGLRLMPWSRRVGAADEVAKYHFRARLSLRVSPVMFVSLSRFQLCSRTLSLLMSCIVIKRSRRRSAVFVFGFGRLIRMDLPRLGRLRWLSR
jgi:hypothetical protein